MGVPSYSSVVMTCFARSALALSMFGALVGACKQPAHGPATLDRKRPSTEVSAPAAQVPTKSAQSPVEDPFALPDDAPIDPTEEFQALRHNCCDETPADQVEAHSAGTATAPGARARPNDRVKHD